MLADIGTKALPDAQFAYLCDLINGYALVARHHPVYPMPAYVCRKKREEGEWVKTEAKVWIVSNVQSFCMKMFLIGWSFLFEEAISNFSFFNAWKYVDVTGRLISLW
jgi:hypothetical protein